MASPNPFPGEVWALIFLNSSDPRSLSRTCRYLYDLTQSPYMIASWIVYRYTREYAFMGASHWWIQKNGPGFRHACRMGPCLLENLEIQVSRYLISMNVDPSSLEEFVMKEVAAMGHFRYVEWILNVQDMQNPRTERKNARLEDADEEGELISLRSSSVSSESNSLNAPELTELEEPDYRADLLGEALCQRNEPLIRILVTHGAVRSKSLSQAVQSGVSKDILDLLLQNSEPTVQLIIHSMNRTAMQRWVLFTTQKQKERIDIICMLIKALPSNRFDEDREHLVMAAAELGSIPIMDMMLKRGGDINQDRGTPLFTAVLIGNFRLVRFLLSLSDTSPYIFTGGRIALTMICLLDHLAVFYAVISTCTSVFTSLQCISQGYTCSSLSGLTLVWDPQTLCLSASDQETSGLLTQQLIGMGCSIFLFIVLQSVMPFAGIFASLIAVLGKMRRRRRRIDLDLG